MQPSMLSLLVNGLTEHMRALPESQARLLAHDLTERVNAELAGQKSIPERRENNLEVLPCFRRESWNSLTVGVPWEAYSRAYGALKSETAQSVVTPLCSSPTQLDESLAVQAVGSGLWGGSLLAALGKIMVGAREEVSVFAPYWRVDGVRSLLSAAGRGSYLGIKVKVFTQHATRMTPEDLAGLNCFVKTLGAAGAEVHVLTPKVVDGIVPFIHAKLLIADGVRAYVGSANFTMSGLDHGIEAGVLLEGHAAKAFMQWAIALAGVWESRSAHHRQ
jgi:phosphatidylserine/phosphatidylglycerophosphate/cardiolipin synthase-like enzyme